MLQEHNTGEYLIFIISLAQFTRIFVSKSRLSILANICFYWWCKEKESVKRKKYYKKTMIWFISSKLQVNFNITHLITLFILLMILYTLTKTCKAFKVKLDCPLAQFLFIFLLTFTGFIMMKIRITFAIYRVLS